MNDAEIVLILILFHSGGFITNTLSAITAHCFFDKKPAIDINFVNDGQLAMSQSYIELTLFYFLGTNA